MNAPANTASLPYQDSREYVLQFFHDHANEKLIYHDIVHTQNVVAAATEIANHYQLNETDFFIVLAAAWFHDTGYFIDPAHHEERGADLAEDWLRSKEITQEIIEAVRSCILATKIPQRAGNLVEQIVCDADLFHLGTDEFAERNKLLRKESALLKDKEISRDEWRNATIHLFESHAYYTDYCRLLLNKKKEENLEKLKKKEESKKKTEDEAAPSKTATADKPAQASEKAEKPKKKDPSRGVDTTFKITATNNQRLSSQADSKAHIMIQVNSIIISVLLSMGLRSLEQYDYFVIPAFLMLSVNVITIIFSVLATRPQISGGRFSKEDIDNKKVNLLFFGNYYKMNLDDYARGMQSMLEEYDYLYMNLIRDVYFQGKVLGRKYHLLRISYNVFMYGLILSMLAFIIAFLMFSGK